jgi:hypothetical protein
MTATTYSRTRRPATRVSGSTKRTAPEGTDRYAGARLAALPSGTMALRLTVAKRRLVSCPR